VDEITETIQAAIDAGPDLLNVSDRRRGGKAKPAPLQADDLERDAEGRLVVRCGECDDEAPEVCGTCISNAESASAARLGIAHRVHPEAWGDNLTRNLEALDG
jgi:hypothetical protein